MSRNKRIINDLLTCIEEGRKNNYKIVPAEDENYEHFYILVEINNGVYKGQTHILEMKTLYGANEKMSYPMYAPYVKFLSNIWHVNVNNGLICVDILKDSKAWSPAYRFDQIILSIKLLLEDPNPASPWNIDACKLWNSCEAKYKDEYNTNLTIDEIDNLKARCFKPYKDQADAEYKKTNNKLYDVFNNYDAVALSLETEFQHLKISKEEKKDNGPQILKKEEMATEPGAPTETKQLDESPEEKAKKERLAKLKNKWGKK